jgi:hypothetical protein
MNTPHRYCRHCNIEHPESEPPKVQDRIAATLHAIFLAVCALLGALIALAVLR